MYEALEVYTGELGSTLLSSLSWAPKQIPLLGSVLIGTGGVVASLIKSAKKEGRWLPEVLRAWGDMRISSALAYQVKREADSDFEDRKADRHIKLAGAPLPPEPTEIRLLRVVEGNDDAA